MDPRNRKSMGYGWILGLCLVISSAPPCFGAEKFPSKPITLIVSWAAGGRTDVAARMLTPVYEKILGQSILVANKPAASGYVGLKTVSTAKPDGYTLGIGGGGVMVLQYTGESKIRWEEFQWIGEYCTTSGTVAVNAESPWKTIEEFIAYAKKNPLGLKHGNSGHGGTTHLFSEGLAKEAGIKLRQVVYKGDGPAVVAVASKEVDVTCSPLPSVRPLMEAGKIRVLAIQSDTRSPQYPGIPTLKEKGINWAAGTFLGLIAPKETPGEIISVLDKALEKAVQDSSLVSALSKADITIEYRNHKDFTKYVEGQDKKYHELLMAVGLVK